MHTGTLGFAGLLIAMTLAACSANPTPTVTPKSSLSIPTPTPLVRDDYPGTRFATHLFVPAGETRSVKGLGVLYETIDMDGTGAATVQGDTLTADHGGSTCFRFHYRDTPNENNVQTLCAVVIDKTGDCNGLPLATLNLERFVGQTDQRVGNADLLEAGNRDLYAVCVTPDGQYLLQQPAVDLPTLYFPMIDAVGDGPYSIGATEFGLYRDSTLTTFSGETVDARRVVTVGREVTKLTLSGGKFVVESNDCDLDPSCSVYADAVGPGDMLRVGSSVPIEQFDSLSPGELAAYYNQRLGLDIGDLPTFDPNIRMTVLVRLATMDIMEDLIPHFDEIYRLRERGIPVIYAPFWANQSLYNHCGAQQEGGDECVAVERKLQELERGHIQALKADGYELWLGEPLEYYPDGSYKSIAEYFRPSLELFDGVYVWIAAGGSSLSQPGIADAMANAVHGLKQDVDDLPVIIVGGGQLEGSTKGIFCEADVCASDFHNAYNQAEAWMTSALDAFPPEQIAGFGIAGYDGAHFDIREPYEQFELFPLNRSGETGYNSPALNVYRAR